MKFAGWMILVAVLMAIAGRLEPKQRDPVAMAQQIAHETDSVEDCAAHHGLGEYTGRWYIGCTGSTP